MSFISFSPVAGHNNITDKPADPVLLKSVFLRGGGD
jgi:hypothetical protein